MCHRRSYFFYWGIIQRSGTVVHNNLTITLALSFFFSSDDMVFTKKNANKKCLKISDMRGIRSFRCR